MKTLYLLPVLLALWQPANAQAVYGCTDPLSSNYNANATLNDGSCNYVTASVNTESSITLPTLLDETSGLMLWNGGLYTINDDSDNNVYRIDPATGNILQTLPVSGATNQDWEEIAQDNDFVYIGDFGNNVSGNRTNLNIVKVDKAGLLNGSPSVNYINFVYDNQTSFAPTANNATDFDCEAMIVTDTNIYLFTKQWVSQQTSLYVLPKTPGSHVAQFVGTINVNGLITGATYLPGKKLVALSGYTSMLSPFMYLLYDFQGNEFFSGNRRKVSISASLHQMEGIATADGINFYMSNEHFQQAAIVNIAQKLHIIDMSEYLQTYINAVAALPGALQQNGVMIYPNPAGDVLTIQGPAFLRGTGYYFIDMMGRRVLNGVMEGENNSIDISGLASGTYDIVIAGYENDVYKLVVN
jgi:hypothetical protein